MADSPTPGASSKSRSHTHRAILPQPKRRPARDGAQPEVISETVQPPVCAPHPQGPPPRVPRSKTNKKNETQHCRYFDFGVGCCTKGAACIFAHVTSNYQDAKTNEQVSDTDPRYLTPDQMEALSIRHKASKTAQGTAALSQPPVKKKKTSQESGTSEALEIDTMQKWLNTARNQKLLGDCCLLRDVLKIRYQDQVLPRFCMETAEFQDAEGNVHKIEVETKTDVVWSAMLYGRDEDVLKHLGSCLLLGFQLRYRLRPLLKKKYDLSLENVLLLTKHSLSSDAFQAVSFVWSLKFVNLPQPHDSRVKGVSSHLVDERIDRRHVFLKIEAFKMTTPLSIISDLDVVICNTEVMAKKIYEFCNSQSETCKKFGAGSVAVMQRCDSRVTWDEPLKWSPAKKCQQPGDQRAENYTKVSYCFAIIRPCSELATKYEKKCSRRLRIRDCSAIKTCWARCCTTKVAST